MSSDDAQVAARNELSSLGRVSHKLALVDSADRLSSVLDKLLPRLLQRIGANQQTKTSVQSQIHSKLVEMLSHIMSRVKNEGECRLPCATLADSLLAIDSPHPLTLNLTLAFLLVGVPRETEASRLALLLPKSLRLLGRITPRVQSQQAAHILLFCLIGLDRAENLSSEVSYIEEARQVAQTESVSPRLCNTLLDTLLYIPTESSVPPPGMSQNGHECLKSWSAWNAGVAVTVLHWIAPHKKALLSNPLVLLIVASGHPNRDVMEKATQYLQIYKEREEFSHLPDPASVASTLLVLCMGHSTALQLLVPLPHMLRLIGTSSREGLVKRRRPLSETVKVGVITFLCTFFEAYPRIWTSETIAVIGSMVVVLGENSLANFPQGGLSLQRAAPYSSIASLWNISLTQLTLHESSLTFVNRILYTVCKLLTQLRQQKVEPGFSGDGNLEVRDCCYGMISTICRSRFQHDSFVLASGASDTIGERVPVDTVSLLFGCLSNEDERLRPRAMAALDTLLKSYQGLVQSVEIKEDGTSTLGEDNSNPWETQSIAHSQVRPQHFADKQRLVTSLLPILWLASHSYQPKSSRLAATRWAADLLFDCARAHAAHLLTFLAGDSDSSVSSAAKEKLETATSLPSFDEYVRLALAQSSGFKFRVQCYADFTSQGRAMALAFGMKCLLDDLYGGPFGCMQVYTATLFHELQALLDQVNKETNFDKNAMILMEQCASCLVETVTSQESVRRSVMGGEGPISFAEVKSLSIRSGSAVARKLFAMACGKLVCNTEAEGLTIEALTEATEAFSQKANHANLHGYIFLAAYLIQVALDGNSLSFSVTEMTTNILNCMGRELSSGDDFIGTACSEGISLALAAATKRKPSLLINRSLQDSCAVIMHHTSTALKKFISSEHLDTRRSMSLCRTSGCVLAVSAIAIEAIGVNNSGEEIETCLEQLLAVLSSMAFRKEEEVAVACGEGLLDYVAAVVLIDNSTGLAENEKVASFEKVMNILIRRSKEVSTSLERMSLAPALLPFVVRALNVARDESNPLLLRATLRHISSIQNVFLHILSDKKSKHLCRETCCMGLVASWLLLDKSDDSNSVLSVELFNRKVVQAFGQTTVYAGSALMETSEQANQRRGESETENPQRDEVMQTVDEFIVGGNVGIGEAALGAYREMAAVSVSLNRPDLLYILLGLSVSHPFWFSEARFRYGAHVLFDRSHSSNEDSNILAEFKDVLAPYLAQILPRLLRATHDPNQRTREQMTSLLNGIMGGSAETRLAVSRHLLPVVDALMLETNSKLWRARASACGALAEAITGRSWEQLGGGKAVLDDDDVHDSQLKNVGAGHRLLRLWRTTIRSLDDIRPDVREKGGFLGRALRGLSIRLCDPSVVFKDGHTKLRSSNEGMTRVRDTTAAAATVLRWLVRHGLDQHEDAAGLCMSTLVEVVDLLSPTMLEPILPDLIKSLLLAVSALEPAAFNYLQLQTSEQDSMERIRLQLAQSGPIAAAVSKCLDLTRDVSYQTQNQVVIQLESVMQLSSGFATRVAAADAVMNLCMSCPSAFHFELNGSANPSVRLLRSLSAASEREKHSSSRSRLVHALGSLSSLCPGSSVRSLAMRTLRKYNASTGSSYDENVRLSAAITIRSIVVRAPNQLTAGGKSDVWCNHIIPASFLGKEAGNSGIANAWADVWREGDAAVASGETIMLGTTQEEKLSEFIINGCIDALGDVSWSRRAEGCIAISSLCSIGVLSPLSNLNGDPNATARLERRARLTRIALEHLICSVRKPRHWVGKHHAVEALTSLAATWVKGNPRQSSVSDVPLTFLPAHDDDLFDGDQWFKSSLVKEDCEVPTSAPLQEMEEDEEVCAPLEKKPEYERCSIQSMCRLVLLEAFNKDRQNGVDLLQYRKVCLECLCNMVDATKDMPMGVRFAIFRSLATKLTSCLSACLVDRSSEPALIQSLTLSSVGKLFVTKPTECEDAGDRNISPPFLLNLFQQLGNKQQPAWTVRESAAYCVAEVLKKCDESCVQKNSTVVGALECAENCMADKKYWKVRLSGLAVVSALTKRTGMSGGHCKRPLILEALLPHKEAMLHLAQKSTQDTEARVTSAGTQVMNSLSVWP